MIYYERPFVTIEWNADLRSIELTWRGFVPEADLPSALTALVTLATTHKPLGMVVDLSQVGPFNRTMRKLVNEIHPHLNQAGIRYSARVLPQRETTKAALETEAPPQEMDNLPITVQFFTAKSDALRWMKMQISLS